MQKLTKLKFLNLFTLAPKMSVTAKVSILHRISGVLLFISIPFLLFLLQRSLTNASFYETLYNTKSTFIFKIVYLILVWAILHHTFAGIRFLFLDLDKGVEITKAKFTAKLVLLLSLILTVVLGVIIW